MSKPLITPTPPTQASHCSPGQNTLPHASCASSLEFCHVIRRGIRLIQAISGRFAPSTRPYPAGMVHVHAFVLPSSALIFPLRESFTRKFAADSRQTREARTVERRRGEIGRGGQLVLRPHDDSEWLLSLLIVTIVRRSRRRVVSTPEDACVRTTEREYLLYHQHRITNPHMLLVRFGVADDPLLRDVSCSFFLVPRIFLHTI